MRRLLIAMMIGLGPLLCAYSYVMLADVGPMGGIVLVPVLVITPFLLIAGGAYYFSDK